jgi:hypothetical protein
MKLHGAVAWGAAKHVESALETLHKLERESIDNRAEVRKRIADFEALRDSIEQLCRDAGKLLSRLTHDDGCDGSCNGTAQQWSVSVPPDDALIKSIDGLIAQTVSEGLKTAQAVAEGLKTAFGDFKKPNQ